MNIVVFDTETIDLTKPFCYNIGYVIADTDTHNIILRREYVVEQVWHNTMCFASAYYANKRPIYVSAMRAKTILMEKFGYICQQMIRDFKAYEVKFAYAYNSGFDERVFQFNCDWFKCNNPFDDLTIIDIRGCVHQFLINDDFRQFCEDNEQFTESGNYSTTAETLFRYISKDVEFIEDHTALSDTEIETEILWHCNNNGADFGVEYRTERSIPRITDKVFTVKRGNEVVFTDKATAITYRKTTNTVILK